MSLVLPTLEPIGPTHETKKEAPRDSNKNEVIFLRIRLIIKILL